MENQIEMWAIVELMGHQKVAGKLTEAQIGGASFIRVDVPETPTRPGFTRLLTDKAIYAINPVSQDVAELTAQSLEARPIESWDLSRMITKQLELSGKKIVDASEATDVLIDRTQMEDCDRCGDTYPKHILHEQGGLCGDCFHGR